MKALFFGKYCRKHKEIALGVWGFGLLISLAHPVFGQDVDSIAGFRSFSFGMSLADARSVETLDEKSREPKGVWYRTSAVDVGANSYEQQLLFENDVLVQINLTREADLTDVGCTFEFHEAYGAVQAAYGKADSEPKRNVIGSLSAITSATFTKPDTSAIKLASVWINNCTINVAYIGKKGGGGF